MFCVRAFARRSLQLSLQSLRSSRSRCAVRVFPVRQSCASPPTWRLRYLARHTPAAPPACRSLAAPPARHRSPAEPAPRSEFFPGKTIPVVVCGTTVGTTVASEPRQPADVEASIPSAPHSCRATCPASEPRQPADVDSSIPTAPTWLRAEMPNDAAPAADAQVQHRGQRNLRVPAGPHVRQQIQAGLPCVAAALHKAQQHAVHGLNTVRRAHDRGKGALDSPLSLKRILLRLRLEVPEGAAWGGPRGSSGWWAARQSPHSACRVCTLPAKACLRHHVVQLAGRPARPSAAPGTSRFALSSFRKISCAKPARRWFLHSCPSALHHLRTQHLVLLRQLSDPGAPPQPQPAVLRRTADGHLWRRASRRSSHQNSPGCTSAASKRLHSWMGGGEHARRLPPVEGQEAHGAVLLQRRIVAVALLSTRIGALRHTQNSCTSSAEMPRRLQSWRSMASKSAHTLSCSSSASCRSTQSGLSSKALAARPPRRAAGSSRSSGPSCAGAGASPPRSWSSCSACSGC